MNYSVNDIISRYKSPQNHILVLDYMRIQIEQLRTANRLGTAKNYEKTMCSFAWLDTGTHDSLSEASTYIEVLEKRQGLKVACLEGIAYRQGWITEERMRELAQPMLKNQYGQYLLKVIDEIKETHKPNLD